MQQVIRTLLIILLFSTLSFFPKNAWAIIKPVSYNEYFVGFTSDYVNYWAHPSDLGRQLESNWCWAASIQVSLNLLHIPIKQSQIVYETFGTLANLPGFPNQIAFVLNKWRWNNDRKPILIHSYQEPSWRQVLIDLQNNVPVILGLKPANSTIGHAVVITGAVYNAVYKMKGGIPYIEYLFIRDPWPYNQSLQKIPFINIRNEYQSAIGIRIYAAPYGF
jgi:hypothetical protein